MVSSILVPLLKQFSFKSEIWLLVLCGACSSCFLCQVIQVTGIYENQANIFGIMAFSVTQKAVRWLTLDSGHLKKDILWNKKWRTKYAQTGEMIFSCYYFQIFPNFPFLQLISI